MILVRLNLVPLSRFSENAYKCYQYRDLKNCCFSMQVVPAMLLMDYIVIDIGHSAIVQPYILVTFFQDCLLSMWTRMDWSIGKNLHCTWNGRVGELIKLTDTSKLFLFLQKISSTAQHLMCSKYLRKITNLKVNVTFLDIWKRNSEIPIIPMQNHVVVKSQIWQSQSFDWNENWFIHA